MTGSLKSLYDIDCFLLKDIIWFLPKGTFLMENSFETDSKVFPDSWIACSHNYPHHC